MTLVIAHRGASAVRPENTVAAFVAARELGADWVELDVRRTADRALAIHHDAALTDGRRLMDLGAAALPDHVPSLEEALDACSPMGVNVEIKNQPGDPDFDRAEAVAQGVAALLDRRGSRDEVLVSSFHGPTVELVRRLAPGLPTALLVFDPGGPGIVDTVASAGHAAFHPYESFADAELVDAAHGVGLAVNVWTCDDPQRMRELADLGVDGIVTNVPDVARTALGPP